jgi:hypothetical protein
VPTAASTVEGVAPAVSSDVHRVAVASSGSVLPPAPVFGLFELLGEHVQMTPSSAIYLPRSRNPVRRLPFERDTVVDMHMLVYL